jgi:hypothetical protein
MGSGFQVRGSGFGGPEQVLFERRSSVWSIEPRTRTLNLEPKNPELRTSEPRNLLGNQLEPECFFH